MTITMIQDAITPVLKQHGVRKAVLFGSHAKGVAKENSDVDLLVDSGLKGWDFTGLIEDLFVSLNKPVDIIDVAHVGKGSKIEREIQTTGVVVYEQ